MGLNVVDTMVAKVGAGSGVFSRYLITSGINLVNHQLLLQLAVRWWGWGGGAANIFAAIVASIPAYLLSRYWIWDVDGKPSFRGELLPFWVIAFVGLVASTASAELADRSFESPLMISVGSFAGYLLVWILKFVVLNYLFSKAGTKGNAAAAV